MCVWSCCDSFPAPHCLTSAHPNYYIHVQAIYLQSNGKSTIRFDHHVPTYIYALIIMFLYIYIEKNMLCIYVSYIYIYIIHNKYIYLYILYIINIYILYTDAHFDWWLTGHGADFPPCSEGCCAGPGDYSQFKGANAWEDASTAAVKLRPGQPGPQSWIIHWFVPLIFG